MRGTSATLAALAWLLAPLASIAQEIPESPDWPVTGLRVRLGASATEVQRAYGLTEAPQSTPSSVIPNQTQLRRPAQGKWFFFDQHNCLVNIRLENGFDGAVAGVRLGDTSKALHDRLGPLLSHRSGPFAGLLGDVSPTLSVRFDLWNGKVSKLFLVPPHYDKNASFCKVVSALPER